MRLPPGPRQPAAMQTLGWWARPVAFMERCRARYGKRFTLRLLSTPPFVIISDPNQVKEMFTAAPEVLHPGEGARILEPVVGKNSVILLDERAHLSQRKLMLPAFHGEKMERLTGLMSEVAEREAASWPRGEPLQLHPRLQALTMKVILRAVFGLEEGDRLERLSVRLTEILAIGSGPTGMFPFLQLNLGRLTPWARFMQMREEADELIYELIEERRADPAERDDILSMLLAARHEDGSPMSPVELRDELMTLLVAGHETTASELAWAFERLAREPRVVARLVDEISSEDGDAYLTATVQETLRRRPVLPNAAPRLVKQPVEVGGWTYRAGRLPDRALLPDPARPRDLSRPVRLQAGAVPRAGAGNLHLDPVRRRPPALPRRQLRDARDEARAAQRALAGRGPAGHRRSRAGPPAQHHAEPGPRRHHRPERTCAPRGHRRRACYRWCSCLVRTGRDSGRTEYLGQLTPVAQALDEVVVGVLVPHHRHAR